MKTVPSGKEFAVRLAWIESSIRRLGAAYRAKKRGESEDGAAAEFSALTHLAELRRVLEGE